MIASDEPIGTETSQTYLRRHDIVNTVKTLQSEDPAFSQSLSGIHNNLDGLSPLDDQYWDIEGATMHIVFDTKDELAEALAWHAHGYGQYVFSSEMSCDGKLLRLDTYFEGRHFDHLAAFKDYKGMWHLRNSNEREKAQNYLRECSMLVEVARIVRINPRAWLLMRRIQKALESLSQDGERGWRANAAFDVAFENAKAAAAELVWRAYGRGFLKVTHKISIEKNRVRVATYYKGTASLEASLYAFKDRNRYRVCLVEGWGFD